VHITFGIYYIFNTRKKHGHFHFITKVGLTKSFIGSTTIVWKTSHLGFITTTSILTTTSTKKGN
jgi:hypothetical protein